MSKIYAVKVGRKPGLYHSWDECKDQVDGFPHAMYKSFLTELEANNYLNDLTGLSALPNPIVDPEKYYDDDLHIYVDGSFVNKQYSWAFVVVLHGVVIDEFYGKGTNPEAASMHNVAGELSATMRAAQYANKKNMHATIYHDYKGIACWVTGEWKKTNNKFTEAYKDFMYQYKDILKFVKVEGHTGVKFNERADTLAKKALGINVE